MDSKQDKNDIRGQRLSIYGLLPGQVLKRGCRWTSQVCAASDLHQRAHRSLGRTGRPARDPRTQGNGRMVLSEAEI